VPLRLCGENEMSQNARNADLNPEAADALLCPRLAALAEMYALLRACKRNGGTRTCHRLRHVDAGLGKLLMQRAIEEDFVVEAEASGDELVLTVSERG
jgi:hypothetical protein